MRGRQARSSRFLGRRTSRHVDAPCAWVVPLIQIGPRSALAPVRPPIVRRGHAVHGDSSGLIIVRTRAIGADPEQSAPARGQPDGFLFPPRAAGSSYGDAIRNRQPIKQGRPIQVLPFMRTEQRRE